MDQIKQFKKYINLIRRQIKTWLLIRGFQYLVVTLAVIYFLNMFLDRLFHFDGPQRKVLFVIHVLIILAVFIVKVIKPQILRISDEFIVDTLESKVKHSSHEILAAYEFLEMKNPQENGYSKTLVDEIIKSGVEILRELSKVEVINVKLRNKAFYHLLIIILLLLPSGILFKNEFNIWVQRNVLLENTLWPSQTILKVKGMKNQLISVPEGDTYHLVILAHPDGKVPDEIYLYLKDDSKKEIPLYLTKGNEYHFQIQKISKPMFLSASGGDGFVSPFEIRPLKRPEIKSWKGTEIYPNFLELDSTEIPMNQSSIKMLKGSSLQIDIELDKPIKSYQMFINGNEEMAVELEVPSNQLTVASKSDQIVSGKYELQVIDMEGVSFKTPRKFEIEITSDIPPESKLKGPNIPNKITTKASFDLLFEVKDDFGIKDVFLNKQIVNAIEEVIKEDKESLNSFAAKNHIKIDEGKKTIYMTKEKVEAAQKIIFSLEANDNNPEERAQKLNKIAYEVVTEEELSKYLFDREQDIRVSIESTLKTLDKQLVDLSKIHEAKSIEENELTEVKRYIVEMEKKQKSMIHINGQLMQRFEQILLSSKINLLSDNEETQFRINYINEKFAKLNEEHLFMSIQQLRKMKGELSKLETEKAISLLNIVIVEYRNILKRVRKWEGYYETVNLLKDIIKKQKSVMETTSKQKDEKIKGIFDD